MEDQNWLFIFKIFPKLGTVLFSFFIHIIFFIAIIIPYRVGTWYFGRENIVNIWILMLNVI